MREYALHSNREICWDVYLGNECPKDHRYVMGFRDLYNLAEYLRETLGLEVDAWGTSVHVTPRREVSLVIAEDGPHHYWELLSVGLPVRSGELDEYGSVVSQDQVRALLLMHKRLVDALFEIDSIG